MKKFRRDYIKHCINFIEFMKEHNQHNLSAWPGNFLGGSSNKDSGYLKYAMTYLKELNDKRGKIYVILSKKR